MKLLISMEIPDDTAHFLQCACDALANTATTLRRDIGMIQGPFRLPNGNAPTPDAKPGMAVDVLWLGLNDHRLARIAGFIP